MILMFFPGIFKLLILVYARKLKYLRLCVVSWTTPKGKIRGESSRQGEIEIILFESSSFSYTYPPLHMYFYVVCEVCVCCITFIISNVMAPNIKLGTSSHYKWHYKTKYATGSSHAGTSFLPWM